jgi:hypothetical protein
MVRLAWVVEWIINSGTFLYYNPALYQQGGIFFNPVSGYLMWQRKSSFQNLTSLKLDFLQLTTNNFRLNALPAIKQYFFTFAL